MDMDKDKRYYPVFMLVIAICSIVLINKLINEKLIIFYLSLINLMVVLHIITNIYMLKRNLKLRDFSLLISFLNFLLFHLPFLSLL